MNGNKDFEKLMKDYYAQMQQLIEKNRRLRQEHSISGNEQNDADENANNANDMPQTPTPNDEPPQEPQNPQEPQKQSSGDNATAAPENSTSPEMPAADAVGSLAVQVTTARGAVPVDDALVVISEDGEDCAERMLFTLQTNNSGETQTVRLATYPLSLSQNPDFFGKPYKDYTITTSKPGYYTVINKNVPVFADRFSIQPVNMIALPENFTGDKTIIITERETLQEGMGGQPQTLENRQQKEE